MRYKQKERSGCCYNLFIEFAAVYCALFKHIFKLTSRFLQSFAEAAVSLLDISTLSIIKLKCFRME